MKKYCIVFFFFGHQLFGQSESVYLHLDKALCFPGDTIWFRAYVFDGNYDPSQSTNLFVELYNGSDSLEKRLLFPIGSRGGLGQMALPRSPGLYWLRAYTRNSGFFLQSITIRGKDRPALTRRLLDNKGLPAVTDTSGLFINTVNTGNGLTCTIEPNSGSRYNSKPFKLLLDSDNKSAGEFEFVLNPHRKRLISINTDRVKGYLALFFYNSDTLVASQRIFVTEKMAPIELIANDSGYLLQIKDTSDWEYSLAVVKTPEAGSQLGLSRCLNPPSLSRSPDTSFITLQGIVKRHPPRRPPRHPKATADELAILFQNNPLKGRQLLPIDSNGHVMLAGLYFYDSAAFQYRINGPIRSYDENSDTKLTLTPGEYPAFIEPDSQTYEIDTLQLPKEPDFPDFDSVNYLPTAIVTPRSADRNRAIDRRYASEGVFANPAQFSFDLVKEPAKYVHTPIDYLKRELPFFGIDTVKFDDSAVYEIPFFKGHPALVYLDKQLIWWEFANSVPRPNRIH